MFDSLSRLDVTALRDLLVIVSERSHAAHRLDPSEIVSRLAEELRGLLGLPDDADRAEVERVVVRRVCGAMDIEAPASASTGDLLDALYTHISERVARELAPIFQAAVDMGWADGSFTPDEVLVVESGLGRLRIRDEQRAALERLCDGAAAATDAASARPAVSAAALAPDRREAILAFAWAVALADGKEDPQEVELFHQLAENLGVASEEAEAVRDKVTARHGLATRALAARAEDDARPGDPKARAALAALVAAGLDDYLISATGVIGLSLLLGVPISLEGAADFTAPVSTGGDGLGADPAGAARVGTPGLVAGTLLLRGLRGQPALHKSLAVVLACLDARRAS